MFVNDKRFSNEILFRALNPLLTRVKERIIVERLNENGKKIRCDIKFAITDCSPVKETGHNFGGVTKIDSQLKRVTLTMVVCSNQPFKHGVEVASQDDLRNADAEKCVLIMDDSQLKIVGTPHLMYSVIEPKETSNFKPLNVNKLYRQGMYKVFGIMYKQHLIQNLENQLDDNEQAENLF